MTVRVLKPAAGIVSCRSCRNIVFASFPDDRIFPPFNPFRSFHVHWHKAGVVSRIGPSRLSVSAGETKERTLLLVIRNYPGTRGRPLLDGQMSSDYAFLARTAHPSNNPDRPW